MLEIGYPSPAEIADGTLAGVARQVGAATAVVLASRDLEELGGAGGNALAGLGEIWVDTTEDTASTAAAAVIGQEPPGIRLYLTRGGMDDAAAALEDAIERGVRKISLPILPLFGNFLKSPGNQLPSWRELMTFADRLDPLLRRHGDVDLRVHYQALWTILRKRGIGARGEEAPGHSGCQAAAALGYIDPSGILYPCASLPLPLAAIGENGLGAAWKGEEAQKVREAVKRMPSLCADCGDLPSCRGGCRGWAHYLSGGWDEPGPDCGLAREQDRPQ
jgi:radical SAM protein with 4Fe4S-binding SPASM domain